MKQKSVLIVDSDESILETLSRILQKSGYATDIARNGKEAFTKTLSHPCNAAIIEVDLPDGDGTELLLKLSKTNPSLVKIVLTDNPEFLLKPSSKGADAYLVKPLLMSRNPSRLACT